jgi:hypothetical protein
MAPIAVLGATNFDILGFNQIEIKILTSLLKNKVFTLKKFKKYTDNEGFELTTSRV